MVIDSKLRWNCRRGMKELDTLLQRYLQQRYVTAPMEEQQAFAELLELPDPQLWAYFSGRDKPNDPVHLKLVERIIAP